MYSKTIKFKLEKKFFNKFGYLDNKYIYDWLNLSKKHFLNSLGIDIDLLVDYDLYYADVDVKFSIRRNVRFENQDIYIKTILEKHNGIKSTFSYEVYVDGEIIVLANSTHNILGLGSDRAVRMDRTLPKWDQLLKDIMIETL